MQACDKVWLHPQPYDLILHLIVFLLLFLPFVGTVFADSICYQAVFVFRHDN